MQCFGIFFLQETYAPKLLAWKRDKLIKETGNTALHTEFDSPDRTLATTLKIAMQRPFILLGTQPILQVLACYMAYLYGLMYLMLSTFPRLWTGQYRMSAGIGSLNFISMGAGFFLGTQITAPLNDMLYRRLKRRNNGVGKPEFRVPIMVPASLLVPAGLFWYGWSAQADLHWIVSTLFYTPIRHHRRSANDFLDAEYWRSAVLRRRHHRIPVYPDLPCRQLHSICGQRHCSRNRAPESGGFRVPAVCAGDV